MWLWEIECPGMKQDFRAGHIDWNGGVLLRLKWKQLTGFLFALPAILFFAAFVVYPFFYSIYLGFFQYDLLSAPRFIGFDNYKTMLTDPSFMKSILLTLYFTAGVCIPICIFALVFALFFNKNFSGKKVYLTIFLMACLMGLIPSCMAWKTLLHQDYGLFNIIFLYSTGLADKVNWLGSASLAMPAMILVALSTGIPYYAIYLIGAVAGIPVEYYEVARLEGANFYIRLRYIVLPVIRQVYLFVLIVSMISAFQYMGPFFLITNGGPVNSTNVISLSIFNNAFTYGKFGYASSMTVILLAILIPATYLSLRMGREKR